jgi:hypothetical protein
MLKAVYRIRSLINDAPKAIPGFVTPLAAVSDIQAAILYYEGHIESAAAKTAEKAEAAKNRRSAKKVRALALSFRPPILTSTSTLGG